MKNKKKKKSFEFGDTIYNLNKIISISKDEWEVNGITEYSDKDQLPNYRQIGHIYIKTEYGVDDYTYEKSGCDAFNKEDEYIKDYNKIIKAWKKYHEE